jgi:hypothetical protein
MLASREGSRRMIAESENSEAGASSAQDGDFSSCRDSYRHLGGEKYLERQYADTAETKKRVQCQQQLEREAEEVRRARRSLDIITNKPSTEIWQRRQREKQPFKCPASAAGARMRNQQT